MGARERERITLEHGVHHHEQPEKQDPSDPRFHLHTPNQSFSPPSTPTSKSPLINTCQKTIINKKISVINKQLPPKQHFNTNTILHDDDEN